MTGMKARCTGSICWRSAAENPLTLVPLEAAAPFLPEPPRPPADGPGRFAFADQDRVDQLGFRGHQRRRGNDQG